MHLRFELGRPGEVCSSLCQSTTNHPARLLKLLNPKSVPLELANWEAEMPAKSKAQQKAAGIALSVKEGDAPRNSLKGASKSMFESMSEQELKEFASTKRKGKPEHVRDK